MDSSPPGEPEWRKKQREYEIKKARAKALKLRLTCSICSEKAKLNCPCGTTQYCSTECQRIDWRDRGHRKACKKIRNERAAEAARAEAPTPPPSPPEEVFYGPAPRSHADEARARIAAEHEAARLRREANPEPAPLSARFGSRCPVCMEEWDVNVLLPVVCMCCCRRICESCFLKVKGKPCPLCQTPYPKSRAEILAHIRRHVENEVPEAMTQLGYLYKTGLWVPKNLKKTIKIWKRAVALGDVDAMNRLGMLYDDDDVEVSEKAIQLFRMAANRGHCHAQFNLGVALGIRDQFEDAFHWVKAAAEQGMTDAEADVGDCLRTGNGVEPDVDEAKRWYARAAAKGDVKAIDALEGMRLDEEVEEKRAIAHAARAQANEARAIADAARAQAEESARAAREETARQAEETRAHAEAFGSARARAEAAREETARFLSDAASAKRDRGGA
jgi:TPR repeat protein